MHRANLRLLSLVDGWVCSALAALARALAPVAAGPLAPARPRSCVLHARSAARSREALTPSCGAVTVNGWPPRLGLGKLLMPRALTQRAKVSIKACCCAPVGEGLLALVLLLSTRVVVVLAAAGGWPAPVDTVPGPPRQAATGAARATAPARAASVRAAGRMGMGIGFMPL